MLNTMWFWGARALYFAHTQKNLDIDGNVAIAAVAKQSRRARLEKKQDGGLQGFLFNFKKQGFKVCIDPKSLRRAEEYFEQLGIVTFEREGAGKVPIAHLNIKALVLFLEAFHPPLDVLEKLAGGLFAWLKSVGDEILGRRFNRKEVDFECVDGDRLPENLAEFDEIYPSQTFDWEKMTAWGREAFQRFCQKTKRLVEATFIYWLPDISNPPEDDDYGY